MQGSGSGLATLTIEAGCEIRFNTDKYLDIGAVSGGQGALYAVGTSGSPITFTSNASSPAPGDWSSIRFWDTTSDVGTILDYCTIQYGGGGGYGNIYCWRSKPTIQNCTISNSGKSGIECNNNSSPTIQNCTISNNALNGYKCGSTGYNYKAKPPAKRV